MYNIFTQWLTLSVIFFVTIYLTDWIEVVTLGGLLTGAAFLSVWTVILTKISRRLPPFTEKTAVAAGVFLGTEFICRLLPGYVLFIDVPLLLFLLVYALAAIVIEKFLTELD